MQATIVQTCLQADAATGLQVLSVQDLAEAKESLLAEVRDLVSQTVSTIQSRLRKQLKHQHHRKASAAAQHLRQHQAPSPQRAPAHGQDATTHPPGPRPHHHSSACGASSGCNPSQSRHTDRPPQPAQRSGPQSARSQQHLLQQPRISKVADRHALEHMFQQVVVSNPELTERWGREFARRLSVQSPTPIATPTSDSSCNSERPTRPSSPAFAAGPGVALARPRSLSRMSRSSSHDGRSASAGHADPAAEAPEADWPIVPEPTAPPAAAHAPMQLPLPSPRWSAATAPGKGSGAVQHAALPPASPQPWQQPAPAPALAALAAARPVGGSSGGCSSASGAPHSYGAEDWSPAAPRRATLSSQEVALIRSALMAPTQPPPPAHAVPMPAFLGSITTTTAAAAAAATSTASASHQPHHTTAPQWHWHPSDAIAAWSSGTETDSSVAGLSCCTPASTLLSSALSAGAGTTDTPSDIRSVVASSPRHPLTASWDASAYSRPGTPFWGFAASERAAGER